MTYLNWSVEGDAAVVTGAASGIGQAIAIALAEAGAKVGCPDLPSRSRGRRCSCSALRPRS